MAPAPAPTPVASPPERASTQDGTVGQTVALAPAAPAAPSAPLDPGAALAEAVQREAGASGGRFGIAIKDLGNSEMLLINDRQPFPAASLFKLPVMYEVFKLRQAGALSFDAELVITEGAAAFDLGTLPWPVGTRITVGTALERMITVSDNTSAIMLLSLIGANQVNQDMQELGLEHTTITGEQLTTTARDMLLFFELIATGRAVDEATSTEMLHLLLRQQVNNRLPALLPSDTPVAHKTGNWEDAAHDVGLVYSPRSTFAIAVLTQGAQHPDAGAQIIARITRAAYDVFNHPGFVTTPLRLPISTKPNYLSPPRLPLISPPTRASVAGTVVSTPAAARTALATPGGTVAPGSGTPPAATLSPGPGQAPSSGTGQPKPTVEQANRPPDATPAPAVPVPTSQNADAAVRRAREATPTSAPQATAKPTATPKKR